MLCTWGVSNGAPVWVLPGASLDLNFATGQYYAAGTTSLAATVSCARASTKAAQSVAGNWTEFAANVAAITDQGLLPEEADTNSIRNPRAEGGSNVASPTNWLTAAAASLTVTPVGISTINGVQGMAYDIAGTASATTVTQITFESISTIVAAVNDVWTLSPFMAILAGSTAGLTKISNRANWTGAGTNVDGADVKGSLTASAQRFATTFTAPASTTFLLPRVQLTPISGQVVSIRLWIGWPQAVKAGFATSPILPVAGTPAASTRAADVISLINAASTAALISQSAFANTSAVAGGTTPRMVDFGGTQLLAFSSTTVSRASNGTNNADATIGGAGTSAGVVKSAFAYDGTSITAKANGGTLATSANAWGAMTGTVYVGNRAAGDRALNGYMARLAMAPTKGTFDGLTT